MEGVEIYKRLMVRRVPDTGTHPDSEHCFQEVRPRDFIPGSAAFPPVRDEFFRTLHATVYKLAGPDGSLDPSDRRRCYSCAPVSRVADGRRQAPSSISGFRRMSLSRSCQMPDGVHPNACTEAAQQLLLS
jgi:hypothetical protein